MAKVKEPLIIQEQGSFFAGGITIRHEGTFDAKNPPNQNAIPENGECLDMPGQTLRADSCYAFYQIPMEPRKYPVVMLHGALQSGKTWETTPDGREGFQNIFLRHNFSTYILDQPRRGKAGRSSVKGVIYPEVDDETNFNVLRVGLWPDFYEGVQFPTDEASLEQFFRQRTPNIGPTDPQVAAEAIAEVFERTGDAVLFSHSAGGWPGWLTAIRQEKVKAIVSFEPGAGYVFPEGEEPDPLPTCLDYHTLYPQTISKERFLKLTKIPIVILFGDNLFDGDDPGACEWYVRRVMAGQFVDKINEYGGHAEVIDLPEVGFKGNTHMIMADLNNEEIAKYIIKWMEEHDLA